MSSADPPPTVLRVAGRTLVGAWDRDLFSHSAQAAFRQALSLPPLLLALLGSLGYVGGWFGPGTVVVAQEVVVALTRQVFTPEVVDEIIVPTAASILGEGRADVVSVGFVVALWAGSSAVAPLVDPITDAHGQELVRHPVWQRVLSLLVHLVALVVAVVALPVIALGPDVLTALLPDAWRPGAAALVGALYYPAVGLVGVAVLTALYRVALPHALPVRRLLPGALLATVVFVASTAGLRGFIAVLTSTGYTYGALATPIAFLLFGFLLGLAVVLGAHLNHAVETAWPSRPEPAPRRMHRLRALAVGARREVAA
jgi:membrane protein